MSTAMKIITDPSLEPVTLAEAVDYARGNIGIEDDIFNALITCATEQVESITEHRFITHTTEQYYDHWQTTFNLRFPPLVTVNSVKYYDEDGSLQTFAAATNYWTVNNSKHQGSVELMPGATIPTLENGRPQSIVINYDNGYGATAASTPETFKTVIKMFVADMYYARRMNLEDVNLTENKTAMQLLGSYAVSTVDAVSLAQFTGLSGGFVR